jgi:hypothetical protein
MMIYKEDLLKFNSLCGNSTGRLITSDASMMGYLVSLVNMHLDEKNIEADDKLLFSDICEIADTYYKNQFIDVLHYDRIISYLTKNGHLS